MNNGSAAGRAGAVLRSRGFVPEADGVHWSGHVEWEGRRVACVVVLPATFPRSWPQVFVKLMRETQVHALVPYTRFDLLARGYRALCLGLSGELFLDVDRPGRLVSDVLDRANNLLAAGRLGDDHDVLRELEFNWSMIDPVRAPQQSLIDLEMDPVTLPTPVKEVFGRRWTAAGDDTPSWRIPIDHPPEADLLALGWQRLTGADLAVLMARGCRQEVLAQLRQRLATEPGSVLVFDFKLREASSAVAVRLEAAVDQETWRGGILRQPRKVKRLREVPAVPLLVRDVRPSRLLHRGGAAQDLQSRTAVLVGCGAIGGYVAHHLVKAGVGRLVLIDSDTYGLENRHRHVLPPAHDGQTKVEALTETLKDHATEIQALYGDIEQLLDAGRVPAGDVLILATGRHDVELRLSDQLGRGAGHPIVHAWLEPLGIGGHVLVSMPDHVGCLRCRFVRDHGGPRFDGHFAAPYQAFQRRELGCSTSYLPFSNLDADRSAVEAVRSVVRVLSGKATSELTSWRGEEEAFSEAGYELSTRGSGTPPGSLLREPVLKGGANACSMCARG